MYVVVQCFWSLIIGDLNGEWLIALVAHIRFCCLQVLGKADLKMDVEVPVD
jgi:hypothetical protein